MLLQCAQNVFDPRLASEKDLLEAAGLYARGLTLELLKPMEAESPSRSRTSRRTASSDSSSDEEEGRFFDLERIHKLVVGVSCCLGDKQDLS